MKGSDGLIRELFSTSTPDAIAILIVCILIENKFSDAFKGNGKCKKTRISIDLSDWRHCIFLLTVIGVILFTPGLNLAISMFYSFFVLYQVYKYYRK